MPLIIRTVVTAAVAALVASAPAQAAVREPGAQGPLGNERLSDETTVTRWAHAARRAAVRSRPRGGTRIATLQFWTEDRRAEVYLVLASRRVDDRVWLHIRIPGRPNGRTGWVPQNALGTLHAVRTRLVVDRRTAHATLYRGGRGIWRAPVGVGAPGTPTPAGRFYIRERLRTGGGVYGPWAFGTSAYSTLSDWPGGGVVGVHGTNQPHLLPGRPSHGCIRVRNGDLRRLVRLMPIGTPVRIL
jgi:lipoprotein-anchoring transpeptidase ErfK/SrfK